MIKVFTAVAFLVTLSLAVPATHPALAQEGKKAATPAQAKSGVKDCRAKASDGRVITWKCKTGQPCCFNAFLSKGQCGSPVIGCF